MYDKNNIYQESVKEKLTFSPIDKYVKYDRFPSKLLIHILLVVLTTISTISLATGYNIKYKSQREVWFQLVGIDPKESRHHIYHLQGLTDHLNDIILNLCNISNIVFQDIETSEAKYSLSVEPLYPGSYLSLENISKPNEGVSIFKYDIPDINAGINYPFNLNDGNFSSLKSFTQKVKSFTFNAVNLKLKRVKYDYEPYSCWKLHVNYEMASYSHIMASLTTLQKNCEDDQDEPLTVSNIFSKNYIKDTNSKQSRLVSDKTQRNSTLANVLILLHFAIFFLAFCSMILNWRYIYEMMNLYMDTRIRSKRKDFKRMNQMEEDENDPSYLVQMVSGKGEKNLEKLLESQKPWDQLTFREKLLFFDLWFIFCIIGNFIQIWASILSITADFDVETYKTKGVMDILVGFSCWFAWLNLLRYLEYNKDIHLLTNIMRNSGPQILRFMIGFLPIFFGYVFLGVCLFWRYTKFESVNEAIITLFSLVMGDMVNETFTDVVGVGIIGEIYLFSFIVLFIVCVHNIFVSIICSKAQEKKNKKPAERIEQKIQISSPLMAQPQQPVYCECCKKIIMKSKESSSDNDGEKDKSKEKLNEFNDKNDKESFKLLTPSNPSRTNSKKLTGTAWENISKGFQIKKYKQTDENAGGLFLNKYEKFEEFRKKIFDQMSLYRKEINFLLDEMRKDAIEDVELYELKFGQKIALKKKYKQQMEYLKSKIKSLLDPLKL